MDVARVCAINVSESQLKKPKAEWIIEYYSTVNGWEPWNETAAFTGRTFLPAFYTYNAAEHCLACIRISEGWKDKEFRIRKVVVIPTKTKYEVNCKGVPVNGKIKN